MFGRRSSRELEYRVAVLEEHTGAQPFPSTAASGSGSPVERRGTWSDGFGLMATRSLQIIIVLALTAIAVLGMRQLSTVVIPILLALILASTFSPVMRWLRARNVPAPLATVLVLFAIALLLTGVGWLIVWAVQDEWDELASQAQDGFGQVLEWVQTLPFAPSAEQISEWQDTVVDFLTSSQFGSGALAGVGAITSFVTGLILMIVVLFFFLKDGPKIWHFMLRPFTGSALARAERVGDKTVATLGSYVRGTAGVAAVDAIGIWIGLMILQVPLALPLSVLVFLLAFIPIVGATLAGILAALVALVANGPISAILVVGVVVLVNQLEGNFLQPVLMGRALKLHSLVILLALTIGTVLSGVLGAVLAVPIAAVAWGVIQVWDGPNLPAKWFRPKPTEL
ncbi:putative PurR-regulated permease PerM [Leucobacter luti]|uniref:AI-2E family transporter n=1 Tax=Leucobacter luti TaxID=340320 RepID=UPI0010DBD147|nr:AI-2E family transporter [Leucobacter luti]MCW2287516.1 putative PurR-regulated permease PerM [Leucobacter luti]TCK41738.1 putative PurR-regulated permease PerM [Leucobacter luti]